MIKNGNRGHMTNQHTRRTECTNVLNVLDVLNVLMYSVITIRGVMYLKDRSPYLDSSFPYSESQNTIGVNLLDTTPQSILP